MLVTIEMREGVDITDVMWCDDSTEIAWHTSDFSTVIILINLDNIV